MSDTSSVPHHGASHGPHPGTTLRRTALALALGPVLAASPLSAVEAILTTGHRVEFQSVRIEPPTLIDDRSGSALRLDLVQELIFDPAPLPGLSATALPAPPAGPAAALSTLFAADGTLHQGRLVRISDRQVFFEPVGADPVVLGLDDVQRIRFPEPRPWARTGELAELDDPELARVFPQLLELTPGSGQEPPAVLSSSRFLLIEAAGVVMDRLRTVELLHGPPESGAIRSIDVPPGARMRIHHATAVDAQGRLYHYLDGNLRQEPIPGGGERFHLLPPHPPGPHLLSLDVEIRYSAPRPGTIEHTFKTRLASTQTLQLELAPGAGIDWATTPGAPIEPDLTDRARPKWRCHGIASTEGEGATEAIIQLTPGAMPALTARP